MSLKEAGHSALREGSWKYCAWGGSSPGPTTNTPQVQLLSDLSNIIPGNYGVITNSLWSYNEF